MKSIYQIILFTTTLVIGLSAKIVKTGCECTTVDLRATDFWCAHNRCGDNCDAQHCGGFCTKTCVGLATTASITEPVTEAITEAVTLAVKVTDAPEETGSSIGNVQLVEGDFVSVEDYEGEYVTE